MSLFNPNRDQVISLLGSAAKWAGGALAMRGIAVSPEWTAVLAGPEALQFYAGIVLAGVPLIRDMFIHSTAGKLAAASTIKGIEPIKVLPNAPPEVKAVAADPNVPNVVEVSAPSLMPRSGRAF